MNELYILRMSRKTVLNFVVCFDFTLIKQSFDIKVISITLRLQLKSDLVVFISCQRKHSIYIEIDRKETLILDCLHTDQRAILLRFLEIPRLNFLQINKEMA